MFLPDSRFILSAFPATLSVTVRIVFNKEVALMGNRPKFLKRSAGNLTGLLMMVGCYALSGKLGVGMRTVVVVALWCEQVADLPMRMVGENRRAWWGIFMRILRTRAA